MLGVTSVTDCRYCQWGHSHWAMAHGVPLEEVNQILGQEIESLEAKNPAEAAAILFAQHYAENLDRFDPASIENLRQYYSDAQVAEILAYVRAITLGSLTGNTLDALLGRFMGLFWWWPFGEVPEISPTQLDIMRKGGSAPPQLIDVRTEPEWRSGHIAGANHVPITELDSRIASLRLDPTRPVVAICRAAHRSVPAVRLLRRHGFGNACQLQGGMLAWQQSGLCRGDVPMGSHESREGSERNDVQNQPSSTLGARQGRAGRDLRPLRQQYVDMPRSMSGRFQS